MCVAASVLPFGPPEGAPESPTGSDEATGCAMDLQRLGQRRASSQPPQFKVRADSGSCLRIPPTTVPCVGDKGVVHGLIPAL